MTILNEEGGQLHVYQMVNIHAFSAGETLKFSISMERLEREYLTKDTEIIQLSEKWWIKYSHTINISQHCKLIPYNILLIVIRKNNSSKPPQPPTMHFYTYLYLQLELTFLTINTHFVGTAQGGSIVFAIPKYKYFLNVNKLLVQHRSDMYSNNASGDASLQKLHWAINLYRQDL